MFESQHRKSEKKRLKALQNQMKGVLKERDEAIAKAEILQEELHRGQLHSRRVAGNVTADHRHKFNSTLEEYQHKMDMDEKGRHQVAYDELYDKMQRVVDEKNQLSLQHQEALSVVSEEKRQA